jgi:hypothetical protein
MLTAPDINQVLFGLKGFSDDQGRRYQLNRCGPRQGEFTAAGFDEQGTYRGLRRFTPKDLPRLTLCELPKAGVPIKISGDL